MSDPTLNILNQIRVQQRYEAYDGEYFDTYEECEKYSVRKRLTQLVEDVLEKHFGKVMSEFDIALAARELLVDTEITQCYAINFKYLVEEQTLAVLAAGTEAETDRDKSK